MALFDFLKKKKRIEKAQKAASKGGEPRPNKFGREKKPAKVSVTAKKEKKVEKSEKATAFGGVPPVAGKKSVLPVQAGRSKRTTVFSYNVVKEPHISEKATMLSERNQYSFKVYPNTNKIEIKKAIEGVYGVDVLSVNIIKIPKKKRRLGKVRGFKLGYTKAIVKIKEGQTIEIL